jgi:thioesterase domain-containing protein
MDEVQECVVIGTNGVDGHTRLVAYVVPSSTGMPSTQVLRAHLDRHLPAHMVPSVFVEIGRLPLNSSGKVDRQKLLAIDLPAGEAEEFEAPVGPVEIAVADAWSGATGYSAVGRRSNFFEIGGHSLLAVRVVESLQRRLNVAVPLRELFAHPVLEAFAARVQELLTGAQSSNLVCIRSSGQQRPLFLIHPGEGEIGYARALEPSIDPSIPLYAIAATGLHEHEVAVRSVPAMAADYCMQIRAVQSSGPYRIVGWSAGGAIACEIARVLHGAGEKVEFLGLLDTALDYSYLAQLGYGQDIGGDACAAMLRLLIGRANREEQLQLAEWATAQRFDRLSEFAQARGVFPREIGDAALRRHLAVRDGIRQALANFEIDLPACRIDLFVARDAGSRDLGGEWTRRMGARVRCHIAEGDHHSMVESPNVSSLGQRISNALADESPTSRR